MLLKIYYFIINITKRMQIKKKKSTSNFNQPTLKGPIKKIIDDKRAKKRKRTRIDTFS
jgi:hypothetical protein